MKTFTSLIISLLCACLLCTPAVADFKKTKIAVLDFRPQGNNFENADMGKIVAEWLITAFVKEGRFEVIERKLLGEVLEEQQMVEAGIVNQETASEIGKLLGVKVIISGSVAKIGQMVEVNARIVDVASASIITAESVTSNEVNSLRALVGEMAQKIMKNFPLEGYIAHRINGEVVIDLGRRAGVKEGMVFLVYREGDVVKHPKTGEILYVSTIKTGLIEITAVQDKISTGTIFEESDTENIAYGNLVKSTKNGKADNFIRDTRETAEPIATAGPVQNQTSGETPVQAAPLEPAAATGRLFVDAEPPSARIRVLNIVPVYYRGMELVPGNYEIEVSAPGFRTKTDWYSLEQGESKHIGVRLEPYRAVSAPPPSPADSGLQNYFDMLRSRDSKKVRQAARHLHSRYRNNSAVILNAHDVLATRFNERPDDRHFVDGMAYLCNILGASSQARHRDLLVRISRDSTNRKLRSYAEKNLRQLHR
jgi:TolB-like protein